MNPYANMTAEQIQTHFRVYGSDNEEAVQHALSRLSDIAAAAGHPVLGLLLATLADEPEVLAAIRRPALDAIIGKVHPDSSEPTILRAAVAVLATVVQS